MARSELIIEQRGRMRNLIYAALPLFAAWLAAEEAIEIVQANWRYGHPWNHAGTTARVLGPLAASAGFVAMGVAFYFFPWRAMTLKLEGDALTIRARKRGRWHKTRVPWHTLARMAFHSSRHGNAKLDLFRTDGSGGATHGLRIHLDALATSELALLDEIAHRLADRSLQLEGPPINEVPPSHAEWNIRPTGL